jgi:hypothetical protein
MPSLLSYTSKMPCPSTSLPPDSCNVGAKLRRVPGSVCSKCYACVKCYRYPNVKKALEWRLRQLEDPRWADRMACAIGKLPYFRWHDAGDIQGKKHLNMIIEVCRRTPNTKHWLPTKEIGLFKDILPHQLPKNLTVRLSATMIDSKGPCMDYPTSTVHDKRPPIGRACIAYRQSGKCNDCRACWSKDVKNVSYPLH